MDSRPTKLIEPFAGGGIVSLTVAAEQLADYVIMIEKDQQVAAVWWTVLGDDIGDAEWLADRIASFNLSRDSLKVELSRKPLSKREEAFQTILRNRVNRGGILASGAGMLRKGEDGKGIKSRWYPQTLQERVLEIAKIRNRIKFIEGDGFEALKDHKNYPSIAFFIDPPYTAGGKNPGSRLYTHSYIDHEELFEIVSTLAGDFLMTYQYAEEIRKLAKRHGLKTQPVVMRSTHHAEMTELLVGRDLDWISS